MSVKDLYRIETNHDVYADYCCERPAGSYANEYVHWLEAKLKALSQHDVSGRSEQLVNFSTWYVHNSDYGKIGEPIIAIVDDFIKLTNCH